jgi:hypothetical protein
MELVVSAEGAVESARFLVPPQRMTDMMLLSNAKMWTFTPALKDASCFPGTSRRSLRRASRSQPE